MKSTTTILLCLLFFSPKLSAQEEEIQISKNAISLDIGAFSGFYSLNYERAFVKRKFAIIPKFGLYIFPYWLDREPPSPPSTVNMGVDFIYGKSKHFLDISLNAKVERGLNSKGGRDSGSKNFLNYGIEPRIGYRFQNRKKGLFFKASLRNPYLEIVTGRNQQGKRVRDYQYEFRKSPRIFFITTYGIGYSF